MNSEEYYNKVLGGWLGRVAGSHFGTPLEFRPYKYIQKKYCDKGTKEITGYVKPVNTETVNDDEIYEIVGLLTLEEKGIEISSRDIAEGWAKYLIKYQYTAEKAAKKNILKGIMPPESATLNNIWFDAIGGQMKADIWGLISPNCPEVAAHYARIDGAVAHSGIGIDGEVFIAGIVSNAFAQTSDSLDLKSLIQNGLKLLPPDSRYAKFIGETLKIYETHENWRDARTEMLRQWYKIRKHLIHSSNGMRKYAYLKSPLQFLNVLPNAGIIVLSLLYGQEDKTDPFGRPICISGMMAYDTDCNCGNIGTIMGTIFGAEELPAPWKSPLKNTFTTYIKGQSSWKITELASRIADLGKKVIAEKCPERKVESKD
ncbi:MAG: ADP-ribosylglycohydrolase family protein [Candidatus Lokiarchaeota archaeon]|nr:ADP-ribosylglycohydrolase family protein [Candidatus Lokiarchaeota archaeon]